MSRTIPTLFACLLAVPALAHETLQFGGAEVHVILDSAMSGGSLGMFTVTQPTTGGPPRHIHDDADEAFYIVDGTFEVLAGEKIVTVSKGEAAFAPKGAVHTFRATGDGGGTILVIVTPAGFEGFFQQVVDEGATPDVDTERFLEISAEFRQRMSGPPLGME